MTNESPPKTSTQKQPRARLSAGQLQIFANREFGANAKTPAEAKAYLKANKLPSTRAGLDAYLASKYPNRNSAGWSSAMAAKPPRSEAERVANVAAADAANRKAADIVEASCFPTRSSG